jgi:hypothetical protein
MKKSGKSAVPADKTGDHPPPTRVTSAYRQFITVRANEKKEAGEDMTNILGVLGAEWGTLNEDDKKPYVALVAKDQIRYDKQVEELKKKGFYTLPDGTKSTDDCNKSLFVKKTKKSKKGEEEEQAEVLPKRAMSAYTIYTSEHL